MSSETSAKAWAFFASYILGYIIALAQHSFDFEKVFPINVFCISFSIGIGIAIYCGLQRDGVWRHTTELLKYAFVSLGIGIVLCTFLQLIHQITGIDVSTFMGV